MTTTTTRPRFSARVVVLLIVGLAAAGLTVFTVEDAQRVTGSTSGLVGMKSTWTAWLSMPNDWTTARPSVAWGSGWNGWR